MKYVLIGAGGHAKVILDILRAERKEVLGIIDDFSIGEFEGLPILGNVNSICKMEKENTSFIIAIGNNEIRANIVKKLNAYDVKYGTAIHPSVIMGSKVEIGEGAVVCPGVILNHSAVIGEHAIINTAATVDHEAQVGDYVHLSPGVHLAGRVTIEPGCHIGIGTAIKQGVTIGENVVVGAGAAVVSNLEANKVYVGVPAKELIKKN